MLTHMLPEAMFTVAALLLVRQATHPATAPRFLQKLMAKQAEIEADWHDATAGLDEERIAVGRELDAIAQQALARQRKTQH